MMRMPALTDPCGRFLPALVVHDLRDRLRGRAHRANARWGRLRRPHASGRLVWIVSGASRASVRLGVELTRALVARRLDITALFTYEAEHPDLLAALAQTPRTGFGYGPADYIGAMHAVWRRLLPFGIVCAGITPRPNLAALCKACRHALLVAPPQPVRARFERIYPGHGVECSGGPCAPPADLDLLLNAAAAPAAPSAALANAVAGSLLWWHGDDVQAAKRLFALFRGHFPDDVLVVSGPACASLAAESDAVVRLSSWEGDAIDPGTLLLADTPGWLRPLASRLRAIHFATFDGDLLWQALATRAVVSVPTADRIASPAVAAAMVPADDENQVIAAWRRLGSDAQAYESSIHAQRIAYDAERRLAADNAAELIERVCRWQ